MKFFINTRSGVPIYLQLLQQLEKGIAGGILKPGDRLPTVREVALKLTVNPNTVARAYRELEYRGLIESVQGRGTFVSNTVTTSKEEEREEIINNLFRELFEEAGQLNIKPAKLEELFKNAIEKWKKEVSEDD